MDSKWWGEGKDTTKNKGGSTELGVKQKSQNDCGWSESEIKRAKTEAG